MNVALIPPVPELDTFGKGYFHLLLSNLFSNRAYRAHYYDQRARGAYIVLDNSAHEHGAGDKAEDLVIQAKYYMAQEVVVPDVLEDGPATVEAAVTALETWFEGESLAMKDLNPTLMYVPQGKDYKEWCDCLNELTRLHVHTSKHHNIRRNFCIGVSKDYEVWEGGVGRLLREKITPLIDELLLIHGVKAQVHLLGWGRDLWMLDSLSWEFPWVRSTDSAKPFVYAANNIELNGVDVPEYPQRSETYFETVFTQEQRAIAHANVGEFRRAACA